MREKLPGLLLDNVKIQLDEQELLALSQYVEPGNVLTVMGPSGSGKSSLLAYIGGFLDPVFHGSGAVVVNGEDVTMLPAEDRHAGILFQDPLLFPHMSVSGNLVFAIPAAVKGRSLRRSLAEAALEDVGLSGMSARDPQTLSGGQKARVALARVLISQPRMLLLDEPFSRLDSGLRQQVRELVFQKARERGLATVLVTHDEADARAAGGLVVDLDDFD